jgi:hypothetical protein
VNNFYDFTLDQEQIVEEPLESPLPDIIEAVIPKVAPPKLVAQKNLFNDFESSKSFFDV